MNGMSSLNLGQFEHRMLLAFVLGTVIGLERQWWHKIAGIKTNALVAGGAALFMLVSEKITGDPSGAARVAANIVTGVGFLGAGIMMRDGMRNVIGVNTAATIWCSAAVGTLAGLGFWYESMVGTAFVVIGNIILRPIGEKIDQRISRISESGNSYRLTVQCDIQVSAAVKQKLLELAINSTTLHLVSIRSEAQGAHVLAEIHSLDNRKTDIDEIASQLQVVQGVSVVGWEKSLNGRNTLE